MLENKHPVDKINTVVTDNIHHLEKKWHKWPYKNTTLLLLGIIVFFYLLRNPAIDNFIRQAGDLGYVGAFFAGLFFVSIFTVAPAAVVLFHLADKLHTVEIALLAGLGGMIGDYIIYKFMKDRIFTELRPLFRTYGKPFRTLFKSPYFGWALPITAAVLIASPVPDEVGVGMMGLSKIKPWQFLAVALVLDIAGIFLIVSAAKLI